MGPDVSAYSFRHLANPGERACQNGMIKVASHAGGQGVEAPGCLRNGPVKEIHVRRTGSVYSMSGKWFDVREPLGAKWCRPRPREGQIPASG